MRWLAVLKAASHKRHTWRRSSLCTCSTCRLRWRALLKAVSHKRHTWRRPSLCPCSTCSLRWLAPSKAVPHKRHTLGPHVAVLVTHVLPDSSCGQECCTTASAATEACCIAMLLHDVVREDALICVLQAAAIDRTLIQLIRCVCMLHMLYQLDDAVKHVLAYCTVKQQLTAALSVGLAACGSLRCLLLFCRHAEHQLHVPGTGRHPH